MDVMREPVKRSFGECLYVYNVYAIYNMNLDKKHIHWTGILRWITTKFIGIFSLRLSISER